MNNEERFLILKNARIVTMNPDNEILDGDLLIEGDRIRAVGRFDSSIPNVHDLEGRVVCPGFIQTHVHLCQTLFRGMADDLELLDWLRKKIWPFEAAHSDESLYLSAMLGGMELIASGTTTILSFETVRYTESVFTAVKKLGIRAIVSKCLMDEGDSVPPPLREKTRQALNECLKLYLAWDGSENGRIHFAMAPRFALACSDALFHDLAALATEKRIRVHSHSSENLKEVQAVLKKTGKKNVVYFRDLQIPGDLLYLAHCIWIDDEEMEILRETGMRVLHCPSSNLKLGSGIAMVPEMLEKGISVSLGADGAPNNNNLDIFTEMRTAALLQKYRRGPTVLKAADVLRMATIEGARALGMEAEIGSIEPGKKADLVILDREPLHTLPSPDLISALVYAYRASDVSSVMVDGKMIYKARQFASADPVELAARIQGVLPKLLRRAERYTT